MSDTMTLDALSAEASEAEGADAFHVDLDGYEGPLHLLLELARRQKVDLRRVSILTLAEQYLDFIAAAREKRIDLAADYLLMAAWLAYLKSRLLLPKPGKETEDAPDSEEMATQLAFRLKRLDAMRDAVDALLGGPILGARVFLRGMPRQPRVVRHTEYDTTLWHMTQAFGAIRQRRAKAAPHRVEVQGILPLEQARDRLRGLSLRLADWLSLDRIGAELQPATGDIPAASVRASVFSAALELARDGDVDLRQDAHFAPIYLRGAGPRPLETQP